MKNYFLPYRLKASLAVVGIALASVFPVTGQDAGSTVESAQWLRNNMDSPQFANVLLTAIERAPSLEVIESLLEEFIADVESESSRGEILHRAGRVFETANRFSRAAELFTQASESAPHEATILQDRAAMLLELGETDEAVRLLTRVINTASNRSHQRSAAVLRSRAYLLGGNPHRARTHARSLLGGPDEPKVLFLLLEIARRTEDRSLQEESLQRLAEHFPSSPEASLALTEEDRETQPVIGHYPVPSRVFGDAYRREESFPLETPGEVMPAPAERPGRALPTTPADRPARAASVPATDEERSRLEGIQTGSFRDRENAEYMVRDIGALGFSASIRPVETESGRFYRVVIPVPEGTTVLEAQDRIVKLKEEGVEGFLLFER